MPVLTTFVAADSESPHGKAPAKVNRLRGQVQDLDIQLKGLSEELKTLQARFKESLPLPPDKKQDAKENKPAPAAEKK